MQYRILQIVSFFLFLGMPMYAKNQRLIFGTVCDETTSETIIGASVLDKKSGKGTITDSHGRYSLWIPSDCDSALLEVSYLGYVSQCRISSCDVSEINWKLHESSFYLKEVEVNIKRAKPLDPTPSTFKISKTELDVLPGLVGEKDLVRYFQLTPGVQQAGDGNTGLFIRGGSNDQNLFLLDDMPLYHIHHLGNLVSTFNTDIIKSAELFLGAFPAEYGGRLSSIVDIRTKDGDMYHHHQSMTLGMLTSKIYIDGPIIKEKASYVASFRINTMPIFKWFFDTDMGFLMHDVNLKLNYILSTKSRLYFSFYTGEDAMNYDVDGTEESFTSKISTTWGNRAISLRFNEIISPQLQLNLIGGHSKYHYGEKSTLNFYNPDKILEGQYKSSFISSISDNFFIAKGRYSLSNNIRIQAGYNFYYHVYNPGKSIVEQSGLNLNAVDLSIGYPRTNAYEHSIFTDITMDNLHGFGLNMGIRENVIFTEGIIFHDLQPRLLLTRKITAELALKVSVSRMWQPFHLLSNNGAGIPADYRIPAMPEAPPAISNQASIAINYKPEQSNYEFSAEAYYKKMENLVDLKEGIAYTTDFALWEKILSVNGVGKSKGVDILMRKVNGLSTGWIGVSLAQAKRQFIDLNDGEEFPYKYDRLLDIGCLFQQQLTSRFIVSATWVFGTGLPYTIPRSQFTDIEGNFVLLYGKMNEFRQKTYHRLDIGVSYKTKKLTHESVWDLSVINVYNKSNPYMYRVSSSIHGLKLYEFSLFPFLPSLSYSVRF